MHRIIFTVGMWLAVSIAASAVDTAERWEKDIVAFEAQDKEHPPEPGGILFLGSSSIRMWDLEASFPDLPVVNRGFGGSQISDSLHYFERLVTPYKPATIVFYAGDNDIAAGESATHVADDFKAFTEKVWADLPDTRILYMPIKPSIARWALYPEMKRANEAIRALAGDEPRLVYIDIEPHMLGADGTPRAELLQDDGLHMTKAGYEIWTGMVKKVLKGDG